jgi:hypothetical protein
MLLTEPNSTEVTLIKTTPPTIKEYQGCKNFPKI